MFGKLVGLINYVIFYSGMNNTGTTAKSRLKRVLMYDRAKLAEGMMDRMREEVLEVITRYVEIDRSTLDFKLQNSLDNELALVVNIPVLGTKRELTAL